MRTATVNRRTAPRVVDGRVRKKNNWKPDPSSPWSPSRADIAIERSSAGPRGRHVVSIPQLRSAIDLLPSWDEVAVGLHALVLDGFWWDTMGWYSPGVVALCAWERDLWWDDAAPEFVAGHASILDLLDVDREQADGKIVLRWTEAQARAFQLLHVLPHELGHHHDRMTTRTRRVSARGEPYAEAYALEALDALWPKYARRFGL